MRVIPSLCFAMNVNQYDARTLLLAALQAQAQAQANSQLREFRESLIKLQGEQRVQAAKTDVKNLLKKLPDDALMPLKPNASPEDLADPIYKLLGDEFFLHTKYWHETFIATNNPR